KPGRVAAGWRLGLSSSRMRVRISRSIASRGIDLLTLAALVAARPNPRRDLADERHQQFYCCAQRLMMGAMAERVCLPSVGEGPNSASQRIGNGEAAGGIISSSQRSDCQTM